MISDIARIVVFVGAAVVIGQCLPWALSRTVPWVRASHVQRGGAIMAGGVAWLAASVLVAAWEQRGQEVTLSLVFALIGVLACVWGLVVLKRSDRA